MDLSLLFLYQLTVKYCNHGPFFLTFINVFTSMPFFWKPGNNFLIAPPLIWSRYQSQHGLQKYHVKMIQIFIEKKNGP